MTESITETGAADHAKTERLEALRLGRALRVLRTRAGLSREEAGARMGGGDEMWAKYERGQSAGIFRPGVQGRLCEALGVQVGDLAEEAARVAATTPEPAEARP